MKYLPYLAIALALGAMFFTYGTQQQTIRLGTTVLSTASSDTLETFRTNVNTSLANLNTEAASDIATSSTLTASQALYATSATTFASVATSTPSISSSFSYSGTLGYFLNGSSGTLKSVKNDSFNLLATSSALFGTTTVPIEVGYGEVWNTAKCFTDTGTLNVQIGYGTASTSMFTASTTIGTITFSSNNTMTAGVKVQADIGTPASSPSKVVCTINSTL